MDRVKKILIDLGRVRENLLIFSDDLWLSIDHNNSEVLREAVQFKIDYNEKMTTFDSIVDDISALIEQYTQVDLENRASESDRDQELVKQHKIKELDKKKAHSLSEDFCYKRPYGFTLLESMYTDITTWRRLYKIVLQILSKYNPEIFRNLPDGSLFTSNRGNKAFSTTQSELRNAMKIPYGIYAEVNLSANSLRNNMRELLKAFGLSEKDLKIYLREDRNADSGVLE